ncbi:MAG TPA: 3-carboxy-cis,cis-muconate cycloisomerase [Candidatus Acidoferrum sp.]
MKLLDALFRWEAVTKLFSSEATVQRMLDFEAALARAEASEEAIPSPAATAISAQCRAEFFDLPRLTREAALAGNLAIPLIKQLKVLVAAFDPEAANFVHWGSTSQDAIDTGQILQIREALQMIAGDLHQLCDTLAKLTEEHRGTPSAGRTWMQHAAPTTLGIKFASWLDALHRHQERLRETQRRCIVLQFGGAVGTLASLGKKAEAVSQSLAKELSLPLPPMAWHSQRDRTAEIASTSGLLVGTLGKIARDIALHSQTEVAELREATEEGRGGSSAMPHKQNPVACAAVLSAAARAPGLVSTMLTAMQQEDERSLGAWDAEWETLPEIICLTAGATHQLASTIPRLEIDTVRMRDNLELTRGLIYSEGITAALGEKIGRAKARALIDAAAQQAIKGKTHLRKVIEADGQLGATFSATELDKLFDATNYADAARPFIDRVLEKHKSLEP